MADDMQSKPIDDVTAELERFAHWYRTEDPDVERLAVGLRKLGRRNPVAKRRMQTAIGWVALPDYLPFEATLAQMDALVAWAIAAHRFDVAMRAAVPEASSVKAERERGA